MSLPLGIVTISDRASTGIYEDRSGPAIHDVYTRWLATPWHQAYRLVPDEQPAIEAALRELADEVGCPLIVTTGGTGPAPRDVTPEATAAVCDRLLPGFGEQMRAVSLRTVPTAILSRQIAGSRGASLIINLPGKPAAIEECLRAIWPAVPYCIELLGGPRLHFSADAPQQHRPTEPRATTKTP
jgi:molybdopterin adenylyltransferase